jgi:hypothetical protein
MSENAIDSENTSSIRLIDLIARRFHLDVSPERSDP